MEHSVGVLSSIPAMSALQQYNGMNAAAPAAGQGGQKTSLPPPLPSIKSLLLYSDPLCSIVYILLPPLLLPPPLCGLKHRDQPCTGAHTQTLPSFVYRGTIGNYVPSAFVIRRRGRRWGLSLKQRFFPAIQTVKNGNSRGWIGIWKGMDRGDML